MLILIQYITIQYIVYRQYTMTNKTRKDIANRKCSNSRRKENELPHESKCLLLTAASSLFKGGVVLTTSDMSWWWPGRTSVSLNTNNMVMSTCWRLSIRMVEDWDWSDAMNMAVSARWGSGSKCFTNRRLGLFLLVPQRENIQLVSGTLMEGKLSCCCQGSEVSMGRVVGDCRYTKGNGMTTGSRQGPPNEFEWMNPASNE